MLQAWSAARRLRPAAVVGLRRLSDGAAGAGGDAARHPDDHPRAERRDGPRQPDAGTACARHRHRLCRRARPRAGARRQGDAHRQSGAAARCLPRPQTPYAPPDPSGPLRVCLCSAAARARGSCPTSCRPRSSGSNRICRCACRSSSRRATRMSRGCANLCAAATSRPRSRRSLPTCRRGSRPPSRRVALGRLDRRRTCGHRPAGDPGAAAACARPGPGRQCGVLERAGGALCLRQSEFTPDRLAAEIAALATDPQKLVAMAAAATSQGAIDAAERLADLVLKVADRRPDRRSGRAIAAMLGSCHRAVRSGEHCDMSEMAGSARS